MDKNQLSQLKHLKNEIKLIREEINEIEPITITDSVKGSYSEFPYTQYTIKIQGVDWQDYDKKVRHLKRKLQKKIDELMDKIEEINGYIDTIEDSETRQILMLRYVNGLTWQEIAKRMGREGDGSTERKKHDRFLEM